MADTVIGKRPYHAFLSHAHVNTAQADSLYDFLVQVTGIPVWYDAVDLPSGASFRAACTRPSRKGAVRLSCFRAIR